MTYAVTRQSNYYDDGALSVEIARAWDYISPGALVEKYPGEFSEHDDPRHAAETAIAIARAWRSDRPGGRIVYTIAGNSYVYPTVADGMNARELRDWAHTEWEGIPKCDWCGEPGRAFALICDPEYRYCSEHCCERAEMTMYEDDDETVGA